MIFYKFLLQVFFSINFFLATKMNLIFTTFLLSIHLEFVTGDIHKRKHPICEPGSLCPTQKVHSSENKK